MKYQSHAAAAVMMCEMYNQFLDLTPITDDQSVKYHYQERWAIHAPGLVSTHIEKSHLYEYLSEQKNNFRNVEFHRNLLTLNIQVMLIIHLMTTSLVLLNEQYVKMLDEWMLDEEWCLTCLLRNPPDVFNSVQIGTHHHSVLLRNSNCGMLARFMRIQGNRLMVTSSLSV